MDTLLGLLAVLSIMYAFYLGPAEHKRCALLVGAAFAVSAVLLKQCEEGSSNRLSLASSSLPPSPPPLSDV